MTDEKYEVLVTVWRITGSGADDIEFVGEKWVPLESRYGDGKDLVYGSPDRWVCPRRVK